MVLIMPVVYCYRLMMEMVPHHGYCWCHHLSSCLMLSTSIAVVDDGGSNENRMVARRFIVVVCLDGKSVMIRYVLRNVDVE